MLQKSIFCLVGLNVLCMGVGIFHTSVFQQDFRCRLLSHSRKPRDIVRRIAHECFQLNDLLRA